MTVKFASCSDDRAPIASRATCARKALSRTLCFRQGADGREPDDLSRLTPQIAAGAISNDSCSRRFIAD